MHHHDVPFFSQLADLKKESWQYRGCGVVSLKMVLEYWHRKDGRNVSPAVGILLETGLEIGAYQENVGWIHSGLVNIAKRFGYDGYNRDYAPISPTPLSPQATWEKFLVDFKTGPVMVSVFGDMDPKSPRAGHIVVVTDFHDGLVFYSNPEEMNEREGRKALALESFLKGWKQRYIVVHPK